MLQVIEIFPSFEGEGIDAGVPTIFIRLAGCSVGCVWCDTKDSWQPENYEELSHSQIILKTRVWMVNNHITRASITGGNPMESPLNELSQLISSLCSVMTTVNIEHPGVFTTSVAREVSTLTALNKKGYVTFDIKPPSAKTKFSKSQLHKALKELHFKGVKCTLKAPFKNEEDLKFILDILTKYKQSSPPYFTQFPFFLQPCTGRASNEIPNNLITEPAKALIYDILHLTKGRLLPQIHKQLKIS